MSQNGRVLYQTNVAPGPFVIQDISEAVQGNIEVRVEEEDGRVTVFQVNAASVPFLTRKGAVRYKTALGRPMPGVIIQPVIRHSLVANSRGAHLTMFHCTVD